MRPEIIKRRFIGTRQPRQIVGKFDFGKRRAKRGCVIETWIYGEPVRQVNEQCDGAHHNGFEAGAGCAKGDSIMVLNIGFQTSRADREVGMGLPDVVQCLTEKDRIRSRIRTQG